MPESSQKIEDGQRKWAKIVAQAWADADFKARLLADPAAVLKDAGLDPPDDVTLQVVENTAHVIYLVLPARPAQVSVEDLEQRVSALSIAPPISCW